MKNKIVVVLITVLIFVSVSYVFDRCSHAIVDDLYNNETQEETIIEETTTKDSRKRYSIEENPGVAYLSNKKDYEKSSIYIDKYGQELYDKYINDPKPVMYEMCKKNVDWSIYPISDKTYEKYNEKDGLLGNIEFDNIELINWRPRTEYKFSEDMDEIYYPAEILVTQGKKKTKYYIKFYSAQLISDIEVYTSYDSFITDEAGDLLDIRQPITDLDVIEKIVDKYDGIVGLTEKFNKEHLNFNGLVDVKSIAKTDDSKYNKGYLIYMHYDISDFDNGIAYFEIDYYNINVDHEYRLDFKLDERGFLDEAKVTLLK